MYSPSVFARRRVRMLAVIVAIVCGTASCAACSSSPRTSEPAPTTVPAPSFPARNRADLSGLVVYQVWLNFYAYNPAVGQTSVDVFANAAEHLPALAAMG